MKRAHPPCVSHLLGQSIPRAFASVDRGAPGDLFSRRPGSGPPVVVWDDAGAAEPAFGARNESSCQWDVRSPAVFGPGDAEQTARINGFLKLRFPGANDPDFLA